MFDTSSHVPTRRDDVHTVSLEQLEALVRDAGIIMSRRQLTRHCKSGTFDAIKLPAANNVDHWYIAPVSIEKGIADIRALRALRVGPDVSRPDTSRHVEATTPLNQDPDTSRHDPTRQDMSDEENKEKGTMTRLDASRRVEAEPEMSRYVTQLVTRIEEKDQTIKFLQEELTDRRAQISGMKDIIEGQRGLLKQINEGFAPVFGALAQLVAPKKKQEDRSERVTATFVDSQQGNESQVVQ